MKHGSKPVGTYSSTALARQVLEAKYLSPVQPRTRYWEAHPSVHPSLPALLRA